MKFLIGMLCVLLFSTASAFADSSLYLQVKNAEMRQAPKHWAKSAASLHYADRVTKLEKKNGWYKVKNSSGKIGYLHTSAVTRQKLVLKSSARTSASADREDVVLAAKGFSEEVEQQYKAKNRSLNFKAVDEMEADVVPTDELSGFIKEGKLSS